MVIETPYSLNLSRQNGIKCCLGMLFEMDDMGKQKSSVLWLEGRKGSWEMSQVPSSCISPAVSVLLSTIC